MSTPSAGITEVMVSLFRDFAAPLTHETMFEWHEMMMRGERRIEASAIPNATQTRCRSSRADRPADRALRGPPSGDVPTPRWTRFVARFNHTSPHEGTPYPC